MIRTENEEINYKTKFSNGELSAFSDTTIDKGGNNSGFRPHELLEAAVASCMNMHIRMFAENYNIDVSEVKTEVSLNRKEPKSAVFEYKIEVDGKLSELERGKLLQIVQSCSVKKTLSKRINFKYIR
jgi:putative redox protein